MDDRVEQALARWPNVPAIAGWLKLDTHGQWLLTDPADAKGLNIGNERIQGFIARNYAKDAQGRYYFQNGPQKAYVDLECTPWIYRIYPWPDARHVLTTHTGLIAWPQAILTDETGRVLIYTELGIGLLHSADVALFSAGLIENGNQIMHQFTWHVPTGVNGMRIQTRIALRKNTNTPEGTQILPFEIEQIHSSDLPSRFQFEPQPKVY